MDQKKGIDLETGAWINSTGGRRSGISGREQAERTERPDLLQSKKQQQATRDVFLAMRSKTATNTFKENMARG